jgi:hypothetical protein
MLHVDASLLVPLFFTFFKLDVIKSGFKGGERMPK